MISVAPAPEGVSATAGVGWARKTVDAGKGAGKTSMAAPTPEEGVEEMETEMSPEPNGELYFGCPVRRVVSEYGVCKACS